MLGGDPVRRDDSVVIPHDSGVMRRAADEINAALAAQPGDPLLEELLLKTYQDELAVLSSVNELTNSLGRADAPAAEKRMQL